MIKERELSDAAGVENKRDADEGRYHETARYEGFLSVAALVMATTRERS